MDTYSRHCILELWECERKILNDLQRMERIITDAALQAGAEVGRWPSINLLLMEYPE